MGSFGGINALCCAFFICGSCTFLWSRKRFGAHLVVPMTRMRNFGHCSLQMLCLRAWRTNTICATLQTFSALHRTQECKHCTECHLGLYVCLCVCLLGAGSNLMCFDFVGSALFKPGLLFGWQFPANIRGNPENESLKGFRERQCHASRSTFHEIVFPQREGP